MTAFGGYAFQVLIGCVIIITIIIWIFVFKYENKGDKL